MRSTVAQPLLGRDRELAELRAALGSAAEGKGTLVLVVGEPGIGKTRLADDFAGEAAAQGAQVTWGRAWEAGGAPAYWPWIEAMRPFVAATARASDSERARIAPLVHLLPEIEGYDAPKAGADPAEDRFRLFEAVAAFLSLVARERPLVVVLDDVHVADLGSLSLLCFVARKTHASRVVVIATYRDVEAGLSAEAGEALAKVAREGRYLALNRLGRDEVARWAATEGVTDADALFAATEGNPRFVVEVLRLVRARGSAPGAAGASWAERLKELAARCAVADLAAPSGGRSAADRFELVKEGELWTIRADTTFRLRDSRGLSILAKLVQHPRRAFHATDLVAPGGERGHLEDAGEVLDARAIAAYKQRLEDLRASEAEAAKNHDTYRAARVREEIDALACELAQGVGLGGRSRKASSTTEKARINVRKRLLDVFTRIGEHSPALAKHLERSIRTGTFCSYDP